MSSIKNKKVFYARQRMPWRAPADFFAALPDFSSSFFLDNPSNSGGIFSYISVGEPLETAVMPAFSPRSTACRARAFASVLDLADKTAPAVSPPDVPFAGGAVGYLSYEALAFFENIKLRHKPASSSPPVALMIPSAFAAFDSSRRRAFLFCAGDTLIDASRKAEELVKTLPAAGARPAASCAPRAKAIDSFPSQDFVRAVRKVKKYIAAGDIFQANIARRWRVFSGRPGKDTFLSLRKINPSPYACFLKFDDTEIISCSPELLVRRRGDIIETRPIAGTRPRGKTRASDKNLCAELLLDAKERAEHIMLVDLERNDLGRVSRASTVRVTEKMVLEKYSHVTHIVSNVRGELKKNMSRFDIVKAMFPGGTITGCPKIRAIEIIDETEPVARGPYCGSAGWFSSDGAMELNILIRTIIKTGRLREFYAGAGIVADSSPSRECRETVHKARALADVLSVVI